MSSKHRSLFLRSLRPFSFLQFIARLAFSIDRRSVYIYIYMYTYIHISYIYIHFIHTYCTLRECRINFWACFVSCLSAVGYRVLFWKVTILFFFFFFFFLFSCPPPRFRSSRYFVSTFPLEQSESLFSSFFRFLSRA